MKKVALFLANGFEEIEALGTIDILRRAHIPVLTVSITENKLVTGAHNVPVTADATFSNTDFSDIEILVLPGGMPGAKHLNEHDGLKNLISEYNSKGKLIAAICAAPMVLGGLGILDGKRATTYPGFEPELIGAKVTGESVVVDENITTGRGPGLVFDFALRLVEQIAGLQARREVQNGLLI
ncbi:MAG: DJ-1/PfpI family protein [Fermentimonas sp.]|jgi:4-methyl-5(b-hydroxyethyl)-thiazole monophosphate biosynthesis|nr:DJ-1/PfpI family protein [Fermentimonas sp.]MDD4008734.1 DJ-1/PfpI family protein [Fermentimonas sp.]MDD4697295.1 DJ-1/PfpI family protein [Fermentimonas sp.]